MANTERLNTLQMVVAARKAVGAARTLKLTTKQQDLVDDAYACLIELEDTLVLERIKSRIQKLEARGKELSKLTARMKKSIDKLKSIATKVGRAAKAVGALADITSKAASAGIL